MKKGFTLVELISVIALVALVFLLVIPGISNLINNKKDKISSTMNEILYNASSLYMSNSNIYPIVNGNVYCIKLESLMDKEYLSNPIIDPVTQNEITKDKYVKVLVMDNKYNYSINDECVEIRLHNSQLVVSDIKIEPYQDYYNLTFTVNKDVTKASVNNAQLDLNNLVYKIDEIVDGEVFTLNVSTSSQTKEYNITTYVDETNYSGTSSTYSVDINADNFYITSLVESSNACSGGSYNNTAYTIKIVDEKVEFSNLPYCSSTTDPDWDCDAGYKHTIWLGCCSVSGSWDDTTYCNTDYYCTSGSLNGDSCIKKTYTAKLKNLYYNYQEVK